MRLNPVNALIAVLLGAVLSYGLWSLDGPLRNYVAAGSAIFFIATLLPLLLGVCQCSARGQSPCGQRGFLRDYWA